MPMTQSGCDELTALGDSAQKRGCTQGQPLQGALIAYACLVAHIAERQQSLHKSLRTHSPAELPIGFTPSECASGRNHNYHGTYLHSGWYGSARS
eukprot:694750-Pleurochrysis_carterae.AAC.3